MNQGTIILTSTGLSAEPVRRAAEKLFGSLPHKSVAIVTTAAEGKENNKYSKLAESQFRKIGFNTVDFIDIENNQRVDFSIYSVIYVCGGNTFKLLKNAREANFKDAIIKLLKRNGIYIGVSAGAIILAPTIQAAASINPDLNIAGIRDFTGLGIVDFEIHPHYKQKEESKIVDYEKKTLRKVVRLANDEALIISDNKKESIKKEG